MGFQAQPPGSSPVDGGDGSSSVPGDQAAGCLAVSNSSGVVAEHLKVEIQTLQEKFVSTDTEKKRLEQTVEALAAELDREAQTKVRVEEDLKIEREMRLELRRNNDTLRTVRAEAEIELARTRDAHAALENEHLNIRAKYEDQVVVRQKPPYGLAA